MVLFKDNFFVLKFLNNWNTVLYFKINKYFSIFYNFYIIKCVSFSFFYNSYLILYKKFCTFKYPIILFFSNNFYYTMGLLFIKKFKNYLKFSLLHITRILNYQWDTIYKKKVSNFSKNFIILSKNFSISFDLYILIKLSDTILFNFNSNFKNNYFFNDNEFILKKNSNNDLIKKNYVNGSDFLIKKNKHLSFNLFYKNSYKSFFYKNSTNLFFSKNIIKCVKFNKSTYDNNNSNDINKKKNISTDVKSTHVDHIKNNKIENIKENVDKISKDKVYSGVVLKFTPIAYKNNNKIRNLNNIEKKKEIDSTLKSTFNTYKSNNNEGVFKNSNKGGIVLPTSKVKPTSKNNNETSGLKGIDINVIKADTYDKNIESGVITNKNYNFRGGLDDIKEEKNILSIPKITPISEYNVKIDSVEFDIIKKNVKPNLQPAASISKNDNIVGKLNDTKDKKNTEPFFNLITLPVSNDNISKVSNLKDVHIKEYKNTVLKFTPIEYKNNYKKNDLSKTNTIINKSNYGALNLDKIKKDNLDDFKMKEENDGKSILNKNINGSSIDNLNKVNGDGFSSKSNSTSYNSNFSQSDNYIKNTYNSDNIKNINDTSIKIVEKGGDFKLNSSSKLVDKNKIEVITKFSSNVYKNNNNNNVFSTYNNLKASDSNFNNKSKNYTNNYNKDDKKTVSLVSNQDIIRIYYLDMYNKINYKCLNNRDLFLCNLKKLFSIKKFIYIKKIFLIKKLKKLNFFYNINIFKYKYKNIIFYIYKGIIFYNLLNIKKKKNNIYKKKIIYICNKISNYSTFLSYTFTLFKNNYDLYIDVIKNVRNSVFLKIYKQIKYPILWKVNAIIKKNWQSPDSFFLRFNSKLIKKSHSTVPILLRWKLFFFFYLWTDLDSHRHYLKYYNTSKIFCRYAELTNISNKYNHFLLFKDLEIYYNKNKDKFIKKFFNFKKLEICKMSSQELLIRPSFFCIDSFLQLNKTISINKKNYLYKKNTKLFYKELKKINIIKKKEKKFLNKNKNILEELDITRKNNFNSFIANLNSNTIDINPKQEDICIEDSEEKKLKKSLEGGNDFIDSNNLENKNYEENSKYEKIYKILEKIKKFKTILIKKKKYLHNRFYMKNLLKYKKTPYSVNSKMYLYKRSNPKGFKSAADLFLDLYKFTYKKDFTFYECSLNLIKLKFIKKKKKHYLVKIKNRKKLKKISKKVSFKKSFISKLFNFFKPYLIVDSIIDKESKRNKQWLLWIYIKRRYSRKYNKSDYHLKTYYKNYTKVWRDKGYWKNRHLLKQKKEQKKQFRLNLLKKYPSINNFINFLYQKNYYTKISHKLFEKIPFSFRYTNYKYYSIYTNKIVLDLIIIFNSLKYFYNWKTSFLNNKNFIFTNNIIKYFFNISKKNKEFPHILNPYSHCFYFLNKDFKKSLFNKKQLFFNSNLNYFFFNKFLIQKNKYYFNFLKTSLFKKNINNEHLSLFQNNIYKFFKNPSSISKFFFNNSHLVFIFRKLKFILINKKNFRYRWNIRKLLLKKYIKAVQPNKVDVNKLPNINFNKNKITPSFDNTVSLSPNKNKFFNNLNLKFNKNWSLNDDLFNFFIYKNKLNSDNKINLFNKYYYNLIAKLPFFFNSFDLFFESNRELLFNGLNPFLINLYLKEDPYFCYIPENLSIFHIFTDYNLIKIYIKKNPVKLLRKILINYSNFHEPKYKSKNNNFKFYINIDLIKIKSILVKFYLKKKILFNYIDYIIFKNILINHSLINYFLNINEYNYSLIVNYGGSAINYNKIDSDLFVDFFKINIFDIFIDNNSKLSLNTLNVKYVFNYIYLKSNFYKNSLKFFNSIDFINVRNFYTKILLLNFNEYFLFDFNENLLLLKNNDFSSFKFKFFNSFKYFFKKNILNSKFVIFDKFFTYKFKKILSKNDYYVLNKKKLLDKYYFKNNTFNCYQKKNYKKIFFKHFNTVNFFIKTNYNSKISFNKKIIKDRFKNFNYFDLNSNNYFKNYDPFVINFNLNDNAFFLKYFLIFEKTLLTKKFFKSLVKFINNIDYQLSLNFDYFSTLNILQKKKIFNAIMLFIILIVKKSFIKDKFKLDDFNYIISLFFTDTNNNNKRLINLFGENFVNSISFMFTVRFFFNFFYYILDFFSIDFLFKNYFVLFNFFTTNSSVMYLKNYNNFNYNDVINFNLIKITSYYSINLKEKIKKKFIKNNFLLLKFFFKYLYLKNKNNKKFIFYKTYSLKNKFSNFINHIFIKNYKYFLNNFNLLILYKLIFVFFNINNYIFYFSFIQYNIKLHLFFFSTLFSNNLSYIYNLDYYIHKLFNYFPNFYIKSQLSNINYNRSSLKNWDFSIIFLIKIGFLNFISKISSFLNSLTFFVIKNRYNEYFSKFWNDRGFFFPIEISTNRFFFIYYSNFFFNFFETTTFLNFNSFYNVINKQKILKFNNNYYKDAPIQKKKLFKFFYKKIPNKHESHLEFKKLNNYLNYSNLKKSNISNINYFLSYSRNQVFFFKRKINVTPIFKILIRNMYFKRHYEKYILSEKYLSSEKFLYFRNLKKKKLLGFLKKKKSNFKKFKLKKNKLKIFYNFLFFSNLMKSSFIFRDKFSFIILKNKYFKGYNKNLKIKFKLKKKKYKVFKFKRVSVFKNSITKLKNLNLKLKSPFFILKKRYFYRFFKFKLINFKVKKMPFYFMFRNRYLSYIKKSQKRKRFFFIKNRLLPFKKYFLKNKLKFYLKNYYKNNNNLCTILRKLKLLKNKFNLGNSYKYFKKNILNYYKNSDNYDNISHIVNNFKNIFKKEVLQGVLDDNDTLLKDKEHSLEKKKINKNNILLYILKELKNIDSSENSSIKVNRKLACLHCSKHLFKTKKFYKSINNINNNQFGKFLLNINDTIDSSSNENHANTDYNDNYINSIIQNIFDDNLNLFLNNFKYTKSYDDSLKYIRGFSPIEGFSFNLNKEYLDLEHLSDANEVKLLNIKKSADNFIFSNNLIFSKYKKFYIKKKKTSIVNLFKEFLELKKKLIVDTKSSDLDCRKDAFYLLGNKFLFYKFLFKDYDNIITLKYLKINKSYFSLLLKFNNNFILKKKFKRVNLNFIKYNANKVLFNYNYYYSSYIGEKIVSKYVNNKNILNLLKIKNFFNSNSKNFNFYNSKYLFKNKFNYTSNFEFKKNINFNFFKWKKQRKMRFRYFKNSFNILNRCKLITVRARKTDWSDFKKINIKRYNKVLFLLKKNKSVTSFINKKTLLFFSVKSRYGSFLSSKKGVTDFFNNNNLDIDNTNIFSYSNLYSKFNSKNNITNNLQTFFFKNKMSKESFNFNYNNYFFNINYYKKSQRSDRTNFITRKSNILFKIKPGYKVYWRSYRKDFRSVAYLTFYRQRRLTNYFLNFKKANSMILLRNFEFSIFSVVKRSGFFLDYTLSLLCLRLGMVYLNGKKAVDKNLQVYVGDRVQLSVSFSYLLQYKWFFFFFNNRRLKFLNKYIKNFFNINNNYLVLRKTLLDNSHKLFKKLIYCCKDVPNYLEVDFFTMLSTIIYEPFFFYEFDPILIYRIPFLSMRLYNWKYVN